MATAARLTTHYIAAGCSRYQPAFHGLNFNTFCCQIIANTSKNDSAAGSANDSKVLVNKIVHCFTSCSFFDILAKALTKIPIKNFKRFV